MPESRYSWKPQLPPGYLWGVIGFSVAQAGSLVAFLVLVRLAIDGLGVTGPSVGSMATLMAWLSVAVLINAASRFGEFVLAENMGFEMVRRLRMEMYRHLQRMTPRQLQGRARGGLLLRFTGDLSMLRTWATRGIGRGLTACIVLVGGLSAVWYLNIRLALVLLGVLIVGAGVTVPLGPRLKRLTRWARRKRSLLMSNVDEQVHSLAVVQVFGRSDGEYTRLSRQNDSLTRTLFRMSWIRASILATASATGWLAVVAVLWVGYLEVAAGSATAGTVTAAVLAARHLASPARRIALTFDYRQRARVSERKIGDFMESSTRLPEPPGLPSLRVSSGHIELREVRVRKALRGVDAVVSGGTMVAIMGPNGAGKSTLLAVVSGLEEPDSGSVLIDGQELNERTLRSRFRRVGMVGPDFPLMRGTIGRNLTYRSRAADEEEVDRVVQACRLDDLLGRLPGGTATWIYEGGRNLSVGERQRLALARAMVGNPPILLLDEPTAGLDSESRIAIGEALMHHHGTVLIATHDAAEAAMADEVWLLDDGRLVEVIPGDTYRERLWLRQEAYVRVP